jgi:hypothetical protein
MRMPGKTDAAWHFQNEQFPDKNYLLSWIADKYPGQQMSAFH